MYDNQNDTNYAQALLENAKDNQVDKKTVKLLLSLDITPEERKNLDKLVEALKKKGEKVNIKDVCYGALQHSGIFNKI